MPFPLRAQIPAQGQGGKDVIWLATGLEQKIGKRWINKSAIAYSRHSGLNDWNATKEAGIFTVREEIVYRLSNKYKLSQGVFYAKRVYHDAEHPNYVNEIRLYPKIYHEFKWHKSTFSQYIRTDIRFFSSPGFKAYDKPLEIRNRYLIKGTIPLGQSHQNYLIGMTEFFFATDKKINKDGSVNFTSYQFTENRSSIYFRHRLNNLKAFFDVGIMFQTWNNDSTKRLKETYLLQIDLIFIDLFSKKQQEKTNH